MCPHTTTTNIDVLILLRVSSHYFIYVSSHDVLSQLVYVSSHDVCVLTRGSGGERQEGKMGQKSRHQVFNYLHTTIYVTSY